MQDAFGVAAGEAFGMNDLAAFAFDNHVAKKKMLADTDAADAFAHDNRLVVADQFAFVVGHFVVVNNQFVGKNGVSVAGDPARLKFVSHSIFKICKIENVFIQTSG